MVRGMRFLAIVSWLFILVNSLERYDEELEFSRLNGNMFAQARFVINSANETLGPHYELFPRIMGELVERHGVEELTLSLAQGRWLTDEWGVAPQPSAPTGGHVHAYIHRDQRESSVDTRWKGLINLLNGIFCTSLTSIVPALTAAPQRVMKNSGSVSPDAELRYGAVGREVVCTENLTPWKKLLPCKNSGLTTLLNPLKLYDSVYHSIGLTLQKTCEGKMCHWRLELFLNLVAELPFKHKKYDFSMESVFGRTMAGTCSVSSSTTVLVREDKKEAGEEHPSGKQQIWLCNNNQVLSPKPSRVEGAYAIFDVSSTDAQPDFSIAAHYPGEDVMNFTSIPKTDIISLRFVLGGTAHHRGEVVSRVLNAAGWSRRAIFAQMLPWWLQIRYHTLRVQCVDITSGVDMEPTSHSRLFSAAKSRERPSMLEWDLTLPAHSLCSISFTFDKAFLRLREFPPDANHGLYVPAASLTLKNSKGLQKASIGGRTRTASQRYCMMYIVEHHAIKMLDNVVNEKETEEDVVIHGNVLLIALPVPDFSMPFNVICFVTTTLSLCFGPILQYSTKRMIPWNGALAPGVPLGKRVGRTIALCLLGPLIYAHYHDMDFNQIRRAIVQFVEDMKDQFEKMNNL